MKTINIIITTVLLLGSLMLSAQVAINADGTLADASAMLDVKSDTAGILIPRMTSTQRDAITSPTTGLLIYQSDNTPGFYFYNGSAWVVVGNEAADINSLADGKTGGSSVFLGTSAGNLDDGIDNYNVGIGDFALSNNTSGGANTSVGTWSLAANTEGINNTAFGFGALSSNISGNYNTAFGLQCLAFNTTGSTNTAFGYQTGYSVTGTGNVFLGYQAGKNETGSNNLYISNSSTSNPLIYGNFSTEKLTINGDILQTTGDYTATDELRAIDGNGLKLFDDGGNGVFVEDGGKVGIGTTNPDASASLDVSSTTRGFLPPRMTVIQRNAISSPTAGLTVYNTSTNRLNFYNGSEWRTFDGTWVNCGMSVTYAGQSYNTLTLGDQCWMAENLNVGTMIVGNNNQSDNGIIEKYCYDNNSTNCNTYGGLYQWDEMMEYGTTEGSQGICPSGWHLPTDDEWKTMEMYLGMSQDHANDYGWRGTDEGAKMKTTSGWYNNGNGTNSSGFTAHPAAFRNIDGFFYSLGEVCGWCSSTEVSSTDACNRGLRYDFDQVSRTNDPKTLGISVRCLKD